MKSNAKSHHCGGSLFLCFIAFATLHRFFRREKMQRKLFFLERQYRGFCWSIFLKHQISEAFSGTIYREAYRLLHIRSKPNICAKFHCKASNVVRIIDWMLFVVQWKYFASEIYQKYQKLLGLHCNSRLIQSIFPIFSVFSIRNVAPSLHQLCHKRLCLAQQK